MLIEYLLTENGPWAENVKPRASIIVGSETMATRMLETMTNRYNIDDKNITSLYKMFQSLQTEIAKIKGTDYWYDSPLGSLHDTLRQVNSVIIGEAENARYIWSGTNLSITTIPFRFGTITVSTNPAVTNTITINGGTAITLTPSATVNTGTNFQIGSDTAETARNLATAITRNKMTLLTTVVGSVVTVSTIIADVAQLTTFAQVGTAYTFVQPSTSGDDNLAAIRLFGNSAKFFLTRHDASSTPGTIPIPQGHVMYVKLPDLDNANFNDAVDYSYDTILEFTNSTAFINQDNYNNDAINVPQTSNSNIGRILVIPIERYVDDARNFWIAFHEDSGANNLFVRGIGQIGAIRRGSNW